MREDVGLGPTGKIQPSAGRQEIERGLRKVGPALPRQPLVQFFLELVQVQNIAGRIGELRIGERFRAPVAHLLKLGDVDVEQFIEQVLQAMSVGVGADQFRGDLGAINGCGQGAERIEKRGDVEATEVEELQHVLVTDQAFEIGRGGLTLRDLDEMRVSISTGKLDETQPVAPGYKPHGFTVDGNGRPQIEIVRQVILIQVIGHVPCHAP